MQFFGGATAAMRSKAKKIDGRIYVGRSNRPSWNSSALVKEMG